MDIYDLSVTLNSEILKTSVAVVIPTLNRHHLLAELLSDLAKQEVLPEQVIVVDSSDEAFKIESNQIPITVIACTLKSAAVQRNIGIQYLEKSNSTIDFVAFLDDDVRPKPSYLKHLCQNLVENPKAVGVSGLAIAVGEKLKKPSRLLRNLKLIGGEGSLSRAAINTPVRRTEGIIEVEWLIGCSVWRFNQVNELRFEEDFSGQSVFEDVIFSIRAAKKGILLVNSHVKFDHLMAVESRPNSLEHYRSWVVNRYRLKTISPESIDTWRFTLVNLLMLLSLVMRAQFLGALGILLGSLELLRKK